MDRAVEPSKPARKTSWAVLFFYMIYLAVALACVIQWGSTDPWSRLDVFSGSLFALNLLLLAENLSFNRAVGYSEEVHHEAFGLNYDPAMAKGITVVALGELLVFLDYGQWHIVPALEQPVLQSIGLAFYAFAPCWLMWADGYLTRHFAGGLTGRKVITGGPFQYVRHPRYAGLIASRVGFALVLASILAWVLVLGWIWIVTRRIRREEAHLRRVFGAEYEAYALSTARLLPGIY